MSISPLKPRALLVVSLILPLLLLLTVPVVAQGPGAMGGPSSGGSMFIPGWDPRYSPQCVPMASPSPTGPMYVPWWGSMWGVYPMWHMNPYWAPPVPIIPYYYIPWPGGMMGGMPPSVMGYGTMEMFPGMGGYGIYPGMMGYGMYGMWPGMPR